MKKIYLYFVIVIIAFLTSCGNQTTTTTEQTATPKTPVEVVSVDSGFISDELILFGTTAYLKRSVVTVSMPAYITQVNVSLGDKVSKGDVLFVLESKENRALGHNIEKIDRSFKNLGVIQIKAAATGVITTLDQQLPGDYVLEGTRLCTIAESKGLVFQVNVPYEYAAYAKIGKHCSILLPDNSTHSARFTKALSTMNVAAQTQTILAKSTENLFLPENMVVKVSVNKGTQNPKQVLPKSCVLSDEMMTEFWVMKLINDSTAVKIPVTIGNKNPELIEILSPQFNATDKIINKGNYGLPDTASISIVKSNHI